MVVQELNQIARKIIYTLQIRRGFEKQGAAKLDELVKAVLESRGPSDHALKRLAEKLRALGESGILAIAYTLLGAVEDLTDNALAHVYDEELRSKLIEAAAKARHARTLLANTEAAQALEHPLPLEPDEKEKLNELKQILEQVLSTGRASKEAIKALEETAKLAQKLGQRLNQVEREIGNLLDQLRTRGYVELEPEKWNLLSHPVIESLAKRKALAVYIAIRGYDLTEPHPHKKFYPADNKLDLALEAVQTAEYLAAKALEALKQANKHPGSIAAATTIEELKRELSQLRQSLENRLRHIQSSGLASLIEEKILRILEESGGYLERQELYNRIREVLEREGLKVGDIEVAAALTRLINQGKIIKTAEGFQLPGSN